MEPTRREVLAGLGASFLLGCRQDPGRAALGRGVVWLLARQDPSGAFPSRTYGFLAAGRSLTPLVLLALAETDAPADAVRRGLAYVAGACEDGALGLSGGIVDYPVYATSMWLSCLGRYRPDGWEEPAAASVAWLRTQQYRDGWEAHAAYGGFGMGQRMLPSPPNAGHVDLSMTRRAIEGLRAVGVGADDPALVAAARFVEAARAPGGGFVYSPPDEALNKGAGGRGYGSATCDGILARLALGQPVDADVEALAAMHRVDRNPGLEGGPFEGYATAMRGYYRAGAAEVFARCGGPDGWRAALIEAVVAEQQEDGSWQNELPHQKEDDPVIATALAVLALRSALSAGAPGGCRGAGAGGGG